MIGVEVRDNEAFEKALRRFSKTCEKAGIVSELKKNRYYEKPSEIKKRRMSAARRKLQRESSMENHD